MAKILQKMRGRQAVPTHKQLGDAVAGYSEHVKGKAQEAKDEILQARQRAKGLLKLQRKQIAAREDVLSKLLRAMKGDAEL